MAGALPATGSRCVPVAIDVESGASGNAEREAPGEPVVDPTEPSGTLDWVRQLQSDGSERATGVTTDRDGDAIVVGHTPCVGDAGLTLEAVVAKWSSAGELLFSRAFATGSYGYASGVVAIDSGALVAGFVDDTATLQKLTAEGELVWSRPIGVDADHSSPIGIVLASNGDVFVAGIARDAEFSESEVFLSRLDANADPIWARTFDSGGTDLAYGVAVGADDAVVVVGSTSGRFDETPAPVSGNEAFAVAMAADGETLWTSQFGADAGGVAHGVAIDPFGDVLISGNSFGDLTVDPGEMSTGSDHAIAQAFVRKLTARGEVVWTHQRLNVEERAYGITTDEAGNVFLAGTDGYDEGAFVRKLSVDGEPLWTRRFVTDGPDRAVAVTPDGFGGVFVAGHTSGDLVELSRAPLDLFLARAH
jgi:hypothetical protein